MTQSDDHGTLAGHAERLLAHLAAQHGMTTVGGAMRMQHVDHAKRVRQLADHLRGALTLSQEGHYPSALVVVRAALEHHLMDRLLFLANYYVVTYGGISKEAVEGEYERLASLKAGDRPDIARYWWDNSGMNVVFRGLHSSRSRKGRGLIVSKYYFDLDRFDPFTGGKTYAAELAGPFWKRAHREEWAAEAALSWRATFRHDKVVKALRVNRLLPGIEAVQVDVHYAFLSGYSHPSKKGYEAVWGRNTPDGMGRFDHYASELILLYVITLAASELAIYGRMSRRSPRLGLRDWHLVEDDLREARFASGYFWFLGGEATMFDRIETVHTASGDAIPRVGRGTRDPGSIKRVRYYADPLERLVRLHATSTEYTTGLTFRSPFDRPDAQYR